MTDKPLRVSATLYITWKLCPAQARARLDGHYQPDTIAAFKGLLAHRIFARHLSRGHIAPSGFNRACRQEIGSTHLQYKMRDLGLKPSQVKATISEVADLYRKFTAIRPHGRPEIHLEHELTEGVVMVGTIDNVVEVGSHLRLVDWKTGELGATAEDQLHFYATLWWLVHKRLPTSVEAVSVLTGERYEDWVDRERCDRVLFEITELVADLTRPPSLATPGPWCRWCPILADCQVGQRTIELICST